MYTTEPSKDRLFWLNWLEMYKNLRCLWDVDSKDYTHRGKRKEAYLELINSAKRIHPEANEAFVKARINCFRTAYRKEAKKVLAARKNGGCYEPTWFYYNILNSVFLLDNNLDEIFGNQTQEPSDSSDCEDPFAIVEIKPNVDQNDDTYQISVQERSRNNSADPKSDKSHEFDDSSISSIKQRALDTAKAKRSGKRKFPSLKAMATNFNSIENSHEENSVSSYEHREPQISMNEIEQHHSEPPAKRHIRIENVRTSPVQNINHMEKQDTTKNQSLEEECEIIGKRIASHFKNMRSTQRLIAERIICDVCIHGRMDQLSWDSSLMVTENGRQSGYRTIGTSDGQQKSTEDEIMIESDGYEQI